MIIGIGSDLIDITRVGKVIERHGERFLGFGCHGGGMIAARQHR